MAKHQLETLSRGVEAIYSQQELAVKLEKSAKTSRPLRVKLGMDPTAPDIHLGHSVVLRKLRQFQDLGHKAVLIIGDFTALIGDPSGRSKTRPVLSPQQIQENAETYFAQAGKILLTNSDSLEIRYNSSWLADMKFAEVLKLSGKMTVGQMLKRNDFHQRYQNETPIGVHEFMYPLMQGYDSVVIQADVELGGTDQTFNNLVGRDLQLDAGQEPQVVMIMPILVGIDGQQKMSKSLDNYVGLTDAPKLMFERIMSIPDSLMENFFTLLTDLSAERIGQLTTAQTTHPKEAKVLLAKQIVKTYHCQNDADWAAEQFDKIHAQHQMPDDIGEVTVDNKPELLAKLLADAGLVTSNSQAKRLIRQGGVSIDGQRADDPNISVQVQEGMVLQIGRRKFARLKLRQLKQ